jgi:hypothetical protein
MPGDPVNIPHDIENRGVTTGIDQELNPEVSSLFPVAAAGHEIGPGHTLKVKTRVQIPLGLRLKPAQEAPHVQAARGLIKKIQRGTHLRPGEGHVAFGAASRGPSLSRICPSLARPASN